MTSERIQSTRRKVRATVLALLEEVSYSGLTYEGIAAASGVAKTTLYRHWQSKAELVFDLVLHDRELPSLADTGSADGDVVALANRLVAFVGDPPTGRVFPGVIADIATDPPLRERFQQAFVRGAQPQVEPVLDRIARRRGLVRHRSVEDLQAILVGSAFAWIHIGAMPQPDARNRIVALIDDLFPCAQSPQGSVPSSPEE